MDARLKQTLTAILYLPGLVPMNGSSTVEGCTKHRWPRNDGIRHGHVQWSAILTSSGQPLHTSISSNVTRLPMTSGDLKVFRSVYGIRLIVLTPNFSQEYPQHRIYRHLCRFIKPHNRKAKQNTLFQTTHPFVCLAEK